MCQRRKVAGQQVDGERQRCRSVDYREHHEVVEQETAAEDVLQPGVAVAQHEEDGHDDVVHVDEQARHEHRVQKLASDKLEPGQAVAGGQRHDQQYHQRQRRHDDGVEHIVAHAGLGPGVHEVLPVKARGQRPGVAVELAVLLDGGHEHPCHGDDYADCQENEDEVNEKLVELLTGIAVLLQAFSSFHYDVLLSQNSSGVRFVTLFTRAERMKENRNITTPMAME